MSYTIARLESGQLIACREDSEDDTLVRGEADQYVTLMLGGKGTYWLTRGLQLVGAERIDGSYPREKPSATIAFRSGEFGWLHDESGLPYEYAVEVTEENEAA